MENQEPNAQTRDDLLRRSREKHQELEALLDAMDEAEMTRPGVTDDWTVKDHLAHLTWWEQRVITMLGGAPDPGQAIPGGYEGESGEDWTNRVNAYVRAQNKDRPLADIRADFDRSYQEMLRLIETVPDDVLAERFDWIDGNSAYHYDEHITMFQAWRDA